MNIYRCSDPEQNPISHWFSEPDRQNVLKGMEEETMDQKQEKDTSDGFFPFFYRPSDM